MDATITTAKITTPNVSCTVGDNTRVWKRFRRKTFAPRRPAVFPEQYALVMVTVVAIVLGLAAVVLVLTQG
jgi:hypothetical protein